MVSKQDFFRIDKRFYDNPRAILEEYLKTTGTVLEMPDYIKNIKGVPYIPIEWESF